MAKLKLFNIFRKKRTLSNARSLQDVRDFDPFEFRVLHRRLAFLLRLSVMLNVVMLAGFTAITAMTLTLIPVKEIRVALLRVDPQENKLYRVEPIDRNIQGFEVLLEQTGMRYVKLTLDIDSVTQASRYSEAARMTGKEYFAKFKSERIDSGRIDKAHQDGLTRSIKTESASVLARYPDYDEISVDFVQVDRLNGDIVAERDLRAYLSIGTRVFDVAPQDKYENPLGLVVTDMVIKERKAG